MTDPYFTTAELRELPDLTDEERFPDTRLVAAHDWIVGVIERECGTSFVLREVTETLTGTGSDALFLSHAYASELSSVSVGGNALDVSTLGGLVLDGGAVFYPSGTAWPSSPRGNVAVTYTAGYSTAPPADLKEAAMRAARNWLLTNDAWSGKDARATSITNEFGNIQLSTPGVDRPTGLPDVDATIVAWRDKVRVLGFA